MCCEHKGMSTEVRLALEADLRLSEAERARAQAAVWEKYLAEQNRLWAAIRRKQAELAVMAEPEPMVFGGTVREAPAPAVARERELVG